MPDPNLNPKEAVKRRRAFEDFYALGMDRSPNKLFKTYVAKAKAQPELAHEIPTRNRQQIYDWCREDNWYERANERDAKEVERGHDYLERVRNRVYDSLASAADDAVGTLVNLATDHGVKEDVRLKASVALLDRIGVVDQSRVRRPPEKKQRKGGAKKAQDIDPDSADEEEILRWFQHVNEGE